MLAGGVAHHPFLCVGSLCPFASLAPSSSTTCQSRSLRFSASTDAILWRQTQPPSPPEVVILSSEATSSSPDPNPTAMGLLGPSPGRNQRWLLQHPRASFPFLEALTWPLSGPVFEHKGKSLVRFFGSEGGGDVAPLLEGAILLAHGVLGVGFGDDVA